MWYTFLDGQKAFKKHSDEGLCQSPVGKWYNVMNRIACNQQYHLTTSEKELEQWMIASVKF